MINQASMQSSRFRSLTSLRTTLTAAFVVLSVLPVAAAVFFSSQRIQAQSQAQVNTLLDAAAQNKLDTIQNWIAGSQQTLRIALAHEDDVIEMTDFLSFHKDDEAARAAVTKNLTDLLAKQQDFVSLFVYDLNGEIVAATDPVDVGKFTKTAPYFEGSLVADSVHPPFYNVGSSDLNLIFTRQIIDEQGKLVGVMAGRANPNTLAAFMAQRAGLGETGETYLVSLESNYFLTPSRFEGFPQRRSYHSEGINRSLAGEDGLASYVGYRDVPVIGVYRWLPDLQVGLMVEEDQAEAYAALQQTQRANLIAAVVAALISVIAGSVLAIRIVRPIGALTRVTQALAAGDLTQRAAIQARNEIGDLGIAFNQMASQLGETLQSLEKSVQEARVATAMAREANRLKSEFLSTMSHELRTPLNAIIGFTEIMMAGMSGPMSEKQQHKMSRIHLNSKRLLDLINDLLDLAKIEAGRVDVLYEPFAPRDLAHGIRAQMESLAEQRGLGLVVRVDPELPSVLLGDAGRIEQATKNLLSNALKFTKEGSVELALHANGGDVWEIVVTDSGIGIPPHALEYIFDEFRQVDGTSQRAYGGSGLGLAITRNLSRIMGGDIRVTSTVGQGSTFTITLPVSLPEELEAVA